VSAVAEEERPDERQVYAALTGACALVAGVSHLALAPAHFAEAWHLGTFFAVTGVAQLGLALALRWSLPSWLLQVAVGGHVALVGLYVASRTTELPFVPPHDVTHRMDHLPVPGAVGDGVPVFPGSRIEGVGAIDLVCLLAEIGVVLALTALLPAAARRRSATAMALLAAAAVAARTTGLTA
jgi:hypothetical protein